MSNNNNDNISVNDSKQKKDEEIVILCLHGKGGNGASFLETLAPLQNRLNGNNNNNPDDTTNSSRQRYRLECVDAPFSMNNNNDGQQFQWWKLEEGERSFNAKSYIGFDESYQKVRDAVRKTKPRIILGHSQGAILLSAILAKEAAAASSNREGDDNAMMPRILLPEDKDDNKRLDGIDNAIPESSSIHGIILNGVAWPNPYSSHLHTIAAKNVKHTFFPKILFVIGKNDKINPPESAQKVLDVFTSCSDDNDVAVVGHYGGHSVPVKNNIALEEIASWIL